MTQSAQDHQKRGPLWGSEDCYDHSASLPLQSTKKSRHRSEIIQQKCATGPPTHRQMLLSLLIEMDKKRWVSACQWPNAVFTCSLKDTHHSWRAAAVIEWVTSESLTVISQDPPGFWIKQDVKLFWVLYRSLSLVAVCGGAVLILLYCIDRKKGAWTSPWPLLQQWALLWDQRVSGRFLPVPQCTSAV